ncbi:sodium-coupled monocarboxylate transporter 2 [Ixodes scapularis]
MGKKANAEDVRVALEYYTRDDLACSIQSPNKKDVVKAMINDNKTKVVKRFMTRSVKETYQLFGKDHPHRELGISKFYSLRPKWVKKSPEHEETFTEDDFKRIYLCSPPQNDCFLRRCEKCPKMQSISLQSLHLDEDEEICYALWDAGELVKKGGLRGVVWTDTLQGIIILVCPLTILIKIAYDSTFQEGLYLRPIADINLNPYLFEASFDLTNDENVWANMIGLIAAHIYRVGMDQMVIQRYAAARSVADAQRTVLISTLLLVTTAFFLASVAMALVFWYRDCDPLLSGAIRKIEQSSPRYKNCSTMRESVDRITSMQNELGTCFS